MSTLSIATAAEVFDLLRDDLAAIEQEFSRQSASEVEVIVDPQPPHTLHIRGRVDERMFYGPKLEIWTEISTAPGEASFRIRDDLTNFSAYEQEFELIRTHPVVGDKILKPLRFLACEAKAVRHHHERYDGKGYPDGLKGDDIPLIARVVTVADAFDAMTSDRPYRSKRPLATALEEIGRGAGTQFDPTAADAFLTIPLARLDQISRHLDLRSPALDAPASPLVEVH